MYTIINVFANIIAALSIISFIAWFVILGLMWVANVGIYKQKADKAIRRLKRVWIPALLVLAFTLSLISSTIANRELAKEACLYNKGSFRSWDSGFKWECYNPKLIQTDNNFRVLVDE